ncbi:PIN domain-containing protein [Kamptonema formosum]|uniref:PIN domain-containing protein n=1 Tax=Kamptonema formosum TaxID=331992 RepID=UPI0003488321|nr:PIN domain-containing protein [Oscillatoria sp. PCC 10802]
MKLYIETNFVMSVATGRDPQAENLLLNTPASVGLAIPDVCYMEALSVFATDKKQRQRFHNELDIWINDAERNKTSTRAQSLLFQLQQSRDGNEALIEEIDRRFFQVVGQLARKAEMIALTPDMLETSLQTNFIPDLTDNLILNCILGHARSQPSEVKVFLSGNVTDFGKREVRGALREAGVYNYFSSAEAFFGWLQSQ